MTSNDQVILEQILQQQSIEIETPFSESELFERFVVDQALKNYNLTYDDIEAGIVDGGNDGGIDAVYLFANEELISVDTNISELRRNTVIELYMIQIKKTAGFSEQSIDKVISSTNDLLNLGNTMQDMEKHYNRKL